jgi:PST family polysaccharide transporter
MVVDKNAQHFRVDDRLPDLAGRAISSGMITGTAQGLKLCLNIGAMMVLARLLTPRDFGLVGMVTSITGFLAIFSDGGLSTTTIQAHGITHEQASNLFWINVLLSMVVGIIAAGMAPAIGWFYHQNEVVTATLFLALTFPLTGLALQHRALLTRQMRFRTLAMVDIGALTVGIFVACSMAWAGFGFWSLVGMQLAAAASGTMLAWRGSRWWPQMPKRAGGTWALVRFGLDLTGSGTVNRLAWSADKLLLGRFWGPASVGLYTRAFALLMNPVDQSLTPIGSVMLPVLSRLRANPERYRRVFLRTYDAIGLISFPLSALFLVVAHPLVVLVLGPKWEGAVNLFAGFTFAALYMPLGIAAMWLFISQGRSGDVLMTSLILSSLTVVAFIAGLPYGALGMVVSFSVSGLLIRLPLLYYLAGRSGPVQTGDLWRVFFRHLPTWGAVYLAGTLTASLARGTSPLQQLLLCIPVGLAAAAATICTIESQRRTALDLLATVRTSLGTSVRACWNGEAGSQSVVLSNARDWFKAKNKKGRYLGVRSLWHWLKSLYAYHPPERFLNSLVVKARTAFGSWEPIELPASVIHTRFHVCLEQSPAGPQVIKLPHGRNNFSCKLIRALKKPEASARYLKALTGAKQNPWFQQHCVGVTAVRSGGGYTSEYVEGINLAQLREELSRSDVLPQELRRGLIAAIHQLLDSLAGHQQEQGKLVGDWPLHNLIFSPARGAIINVDAEGFFTYDNRSGEAHLPFIEANLRNLAELIKLMDGREPDDAEILNIFKVLDEVRRSGEQYSGAGAVVGYHSLELKGKKFRGQRECAERLAQVPYDFKHKVVVDLGCNVGGMLHCLGKTIRRGYGFDVNPNCINAAQLIRNLNQAGNLEFYTFDLDAQPMSLLNCFLQGQKPDICFLLSMCRWLERWEEVVCEASQLAGTLLFESNGSPREQEKQAALLQKYFQQVNLISESSPDDFVLGDRKLYLCTERFKGAADRA